MGSADRVTGEEVTSVVPAVNFRVWSPVPSMPRSPNFATPLALVMAVAVPSSVPLPDASAGSHFYRADRIPAAVLHNDFRLHQGIEYLAGQCRYRRVGRDLDGSRTPTIFRGGRHEGHRRTRQAGCGCRRPLGAGGGPEHAGYGGKSVGAGRDRRGRTLPPP